MDKIIEEAKKLRAGIDNHPVIQEYYRLQALYVKDETLKEMRKDIARLKSLGKEEEASNLLKLYNKNPLVNNYEAAKQEARELLSAIKDIIQ